MLIRDFRVCKVTKNHFNSSWLLMLVTMGTHGTNELFLKKKSIKNKTNSFFIQLLSVSLQVCPKNCWTNINYIRYIFFLSTTVSKHFTIGPNWNYLLRRFVKLRYSEKATKIWKKIFIFVWRYLLVQKKFGDF